MINNRKRGIMVGVAVAAVLVLVFGVTFALWTYSNTLQNQELVAGDIFMKYTESKELTIEGALPKAKPGENDYFEFTIEGRNKYSKPIWYEIVLNYGADDTSRKTRIKDNFLMFRLVETKDGVDTTVLDNVTYTNLKSKKIWVNTIPANQNEGITIKYKLCMWISPKTNIGNTDLADYDMEKWSDVFASIRVSVNGDFEEKELNPKAVDIVKSTLGQDGGVIGVSNSNTKITEGYENIREYRYSGLNVDNYAYFNCEPKTSYENAKTNCEIWRIVGVFKDDKGEHLKIVKNDSLTGIFPENYVIEGVTYNIKAVNDDSVYWNKNTSGTNNNDWTTAGLQYWLNTKTDTDGQNKGYLSYLKNDVEEMIEETNFYLGNITYEAHVGYPDDKYISDSAKSSYANERRDTICSNSSESGCSDGIYSGNKATWTGKVGLLYLSDYGFTFSYNNWGSALDWDLGLAGRDKIWLDTLDDGNSERKLLINPSSSSNNSVVIWKCFDGASRQDADYYVQYSNISNNINPTLYLKEFVKITNGDGSKESPYFLSVE